MGDVLEADDAYTGGEHTRGVVDTAIAVGVELRLSSRDMRDLEFGALLHDIGKLRVPNEIINKPGGLSEDEWAVMRSSTRCSGSRCSTVWVAPSPTPGGSCARTTSDGTVRATPMACEVRRDPNCCPHHLRLRLVLVQ